MKKAAASSHQDLSQLVKHSSRSTLITEDISHQRKARKNLPISRF
jgi:hypothetical protein